MKVVLDTNVLISGLFFGGNPGKIIDLWVKGEVEVLVTEAILLEYEAVLDRLARKYPKSSARQLFHLIALKATTVEGYALPPDSCNDPDDVKFLECAVGGGASFIVSGDKHLLDLHVWDTIPIQSAAVFLKEHWS